MGKEKNEFPSANALDEGFLEQVSGGAKARGGAGGGIGRNGSNSIRVSCWSCHRHFPADISKDGCKCPYCGEWNGFDG